MNPRLLYSLISLVTGLLTGIGPLIGYSGNPVSTVGGFLSASVFVLWIFPQVKSAGWLIKGWWFYCILFFLTGFILIRFERPSVPVKEDQLCKVSGKVIEVNVVSDKMMQVVLRSGFCQTDSVWSKCKGKIVLLCRPGENIVRAGESWEFGPVRIVIIKRGKSGQGFRADLYWLSRGVLHEAWVYNGQMRLLTPAGSGNIRRMLAGWQRMLVDKIKSTGLNNDSSALLAAMLFGDRKQLDKEVVRGFSEAGIVHVLSVSGLHIGIIYLVINWIIKSLLFIPFKVRQFLAVFCVWIYTGLTGFSPSSCRAAGMISLFALSGLLGRKLRGLEILLSTALLHCLINPWVIFSCGAQLSYLAVAGIFIWMPWFSSLSPGKWMWRKVIESLGVSVSAQSLLIPVLIFWFGWFPLFFLIGNLIFMPVLVACFYLGIIFVVCSLASIHLGFAHQIIDIPVRISIQGAEWMGQIPGNEVHLRSPDFTGMLLYYCCMIFILTYLGTPSVIKVRRFISFMGITGLINLAMRILG